MASPRHQDGSAKLGGGRFGRLHRLHRFGLCVLSFAILGVVAFGLAPILPRIVHLQDQIDLLKESEIRSGAIFYTDVEEVPSMASVVNDTVHPPKPAGPTR